MIPSTLHTVGRLSLQTAHKVGSDSARRSFVFFAKGEVKQALSQAYTSWLQTSKLPPGERPTNKPVPFKLQVVNAILAYIQDKLKDSLDFQDDLELLKSLPGCTEAVTQSSPPDGSDAWPLVLVLRDCDKSSSLRDCLLHDKWKTHQGRDHNLGWRAARHQPTAQVERVLSARRVSVQKPPMRLVDVATKGAVSCMSFSNVFFFPCSLLVLPTCRNGGVALLASYQRVSSLLVCWRRVSSLLPNSPSSLLLLLLLLFGLFLFFGLFISTFGLFISLFPRCFPCFLPPLLPSANAADSFGVGLRCWLGVPLAAGPPSPFILPFPLVYLVRFPFFRLPLRT